MAPTTRSVVRMFHEYGHRSSMHGLSHMYHTTDTCRRIFWLVLSVLGTGACLFHVIMTVRNYLDTPVTSVLIEDAVMSEFPDVTLCNLKPMSESLGDYYKEVLHHHLEKRYGFFEQWWPDERKRRRNESRVVYHRRLREIFQRYLEIFWVSDDSRDLGISDKVMLLHCSFNGIPCGDKNFSLLQSYRYWNCYTFRPAPEFRFASSGHMEDTGLNLILYTDSNFHESIYNLSATYRRRKHDVEEMTNPYSLKEYITTGGRTFNQILSGGRYEVEGVRIWLHMRVDHPMLSNIYNDVQNGYSANLDVDQVLYETKNQPGERECQLVPHETIEYITSFGSSSESIRKRRYTKTDRESVVEAKQHFVHEHCGCYSHHYPFHVNTTELCYYVPTEQSLDPPDELLNTRIPCHDRYVLQAEKASYSYIQKHRNHKACKYTKFVTYKDTMSWPRMEEHVSFVNEYVIPRLHNGTEYLTSSDEHKHHIFNFSDPEVMSVINKIKKSLLSHEELALRGMLNQECHENQSSTESLDTFWCLDKAKMAFNVLRVIIKANSPAAAKYEEKFSYEWPEALSEIGGVFGLWVGMSLLTFFEFIELVYLMATSRDTNAPMLCIEGLSQQDLSQIQHHPLGQLLLRELQQEVMMDDEDAQKQQLRLPTADNQHGLMPDPIDLKAGTADATEKSDSEQDHQPVESI